MKSCPFCTDKHIDERVIVQNRYVRAFPTNTPIVPMHVLIAPVRHVTSMAELTDKEHAAMFEIAKQLSEVFTKHFEAEGFNYAWNEGLLAGQSIAHLHLHVLPRKTGDSGITKYDPRKFLYRPGNRGTARENRLRAISKVVRTALRLVM